MKYCIVLLAVALVGSIFIVGRAPAQTRAGGALPTGLDGEVGDFWQRWEGDEPSEANRGAAPNADGQQAWAGIGQAADEFQFRAGGRCLGHSEVIRKIMGDRMAYVSYLALYEPAPMRVQLLFYKAKDKWSAVGLRIDSNTTRWMEEVNAIQVVPEAQQEE